LLVQHNSQGVLQSEFEKEDGELVPLTIKDPCDYLEKTQSCRPSCGDCQRGKVTVQARKETAGDGASPAGKGQEKFQVEKPVGSD
jgi:hypothetical protein